MFNKKGQVPGLNQRKSSLPVDNGSRNLVASLGIQRKLDEQEKTKKVIEIKGNLRPLMTLVLAIKQPEIKIDCFFKCR